MVLALRVGDANADTSPSTLAQPLFFDVVRLRGGGDGGAPAVVASVALPTGREGVAGGASYRGACTLGAGQWLARWNFDRDGMPSNTANGMFGLVPCYDVPAGEELTAAARKTIARVDSRLAIDTKLTGFINTGVSLVAGASSGWRQVASADGVVRFYTAGVAGLDGGVRYIADATALTAGGAFVSTALLLSPVAGSSNVPGRRDVRGLSIYKGRLHVVSSTLDVSWDAITSVGAPGTLPTAPTSSLTRMTPGLVSPCNFVFADSAAVWVSVGNKAAPGTVLLLQRATSGAWSVAHTVVFSFSRFVYSLTGRVEFDRFVVYGADAGSVYRYDTAGVATGVARADVVASAPAGTAYRGVLFAGRSQVTSPSQSESPSLPATPTRTRSASSPSPTRTRSVARTPSRTRTRSRKPRL